MVGGSGGDGGGGIGNEIDAGFGMKWAKGPSMARCSRLGVWARGGEGAFRDAPIGTIGGSPFVGCGTGGLRVVAGSEHSGCSAAAGIQPVGDTCETWREGGFSSDMVGTSDLVPVVACDAALSSSIKAVLDVEDFSLDLA